MLFNKFLVVRRDKESGHYIKSISTIFFYKNTFVRCCTKLKISWPNVTNLYNNSKISKSLVFIKFWNLTFNYEKKLLIIEKQFYESIENFGATLLCTCTYKAIFDHRIFWHNGFRLKIILPMLRMFQVSTPCNNL